MSKVFVGICALGLLVFTNALAQESVRPISLRAAPGTENSSLDIRGLVVCTNEEDESLAMQDAADIARKNPFGNVNKVFPDGTACRTFPESAFALLTGSGSEPGGPNSAIIAEIYRKDWGHAYVILPPAPNS